VTADPISGSSAEVEPPGSRRARWSWALFDWAGQPYFTLINTFVFAPYFASQVAPDPATGQAMWGWALAAAGLGGRDSVPACWEPMPIRQPDTRPLIGGFSLVLVIAATALWWAAPGANTLWPILVAAAIGNLCAEALLVLINAMLPAVSKPGGMGRLGGTAWGIGYAGGLVALGADAGLRQWPIPAPAGPLLEWNQCLDSTRQTAKAHARQGHSRRSG
jgi:UMF1 family MFS transporter